MAKLASKSLKDLQPSKELKEALLYVNVPKTTSKKIEERQKNHEDFVIKITGSKMDVLESETLSPQLQSWFLSKLKEMATLVCDQKEMVEKTEYLKQEIKEMGGLLKGWHEELKLGYDHICKITALEDCYIDKNNKLRLKNEDMLTQEKINDFFDTFSRIVKNTEDTIMELDTSQNEEDFVIQTLLLKKIRLLKSALNREENQPSWSVRKGEYYKKITRYIKEVAKLTPISKDYSKKTCFINRLEKLENTEL